MFTVSFIPSYFVTEHLIQYGYVIVFQHATDTLNLYSVTKLQQINRNFVASFTLHTFLNSDLHTVYFSIIFSPHIKDTSYFKQCWALYIHVTAKFALNQ